MSLPDEQLIERTLAGDLEGFGELHRRYFARVVGVVEGILSDRAGAEDTAQSAYLAAWEALPRLVDRDRFYPWIRRIAVNRAIEEKRRRDRKGRLHSEWVTASRVDRAIEDTPGAPLDSLVREERAERVQEALGELPEGMRAAVVLRYFDELSMSRIAEVLGCEEVTARTQVFRGLRKLGRILDDMAPDGEKAGG
jgi:RNA polymerase sigma-70 factor (ECF subfamily)